MIKLEEVTKNFGKLKVLKGVDINLSKGECIALIGPNGCGKTTLIKSILGLVIPTNGNILFDGKSIKNEYKYRKNIGYMPQIGRYPDNMNIGQIIQMMKELRGQDELVDYELYEKFKLNDLLLKKMRTLSGGTTQKVSAVLSFMFNSDVLILDEPTAGLDPVASEILKEKILKEKAKGKLIIITSHLLSELDDLITEIIFMQEGNILFHKKVDELLKETGEQKISKAISFYLNNESK